MSEDNFDELMDSEISLDISEDDFETPEDDDLLNIEPQQSSDIKKYVLIGLLVVLGYLGWNLGQSIYIDRYSYADLRSSHMEGDHAKVKSIIEHLNEHKSSPDAVCYEGLYTLLGIEYSKNITSGLKQLKSGIKQGCRDGGKLFYDHVISLKGEKRSNFISLNEDLISELLELSESKGGGDSVAIMSEYYSNPNVENYNEAKAIRYLQRGEVTPEVALKIGSMYASPEGVQNIETGYAYLQQALSAGLHEAFYILGKIYLEGYKNEGTGFEIRKNPSKGMEYLKISVYKGGLENAIEVGDIFYYGRYGVGRSYKSALFNYNNALKYKEIKPEDVVYVYSKMLSMYREGKGVQKNPEMVRKIQAKLNSFKKSNNL